ncbi:MAG: SpoIIE family protein phosphatase [Phycisphaerae bacterium]|nr:SpoIIE family protein phosphatase [Phycisphaerae bacterium]
MASNSRLLWLSDDDVSENVRAAAGMKWEVVPADPDAPLAAQADGTPLVVIRPNGRADEPRWLESVMTQLDRADAVGVFLLPAEARIAWGMLARRAGQFICVAEDAAPEELSTTFTAAGALQPALRALRKELDASRSIQPGVATEAMDEELRLASRLQRDFLPHSLPAVGRIRFDVLFRPAGWVSGDIYDVTRLDETHVGFYVADAVGHGMPAALLTMFIKKALQMKRIAGHSYELVAPGDSLQELNADICAQDLTSCQFCTAVHGIVDTETLTVRYARAGHPEPLLFHADGQIERLSDGDCLLGVFPEETFGGSEVQLAPGDRLVLYSDGLEEALVADCGGPCSVATALSEYAGAARDAFLEALSQRIEGVRATQGPTDDITVLVLDVERT